MRKLWTRALLLVITGTALTGCLWPYEGDEGYDHDRGRHEEGYRHEHDRREGDHGDRRREGEHGDRERDHDHWEDREHR